MANDGLDCNKRFLPFSFGLAFAILINKNFKGRGFYRLVLDTMGSSGLCSSVFLEMDVQF